MKINNRYLKIALIILLIIIPLVTALSYRLYITRLPLSHKWAEDTVKGYYKNIITSEVYKKYPQLPSHMYQDIIDKEFKEFYNANKKQIENDIDLTINRIKNEFKDENNDIYLGDIDTYYYYQRTKNLIENGHSGDIIKNGTSWNSYMYAPWGVPAGKQGHEYFNAIFYKIIHIFLPDKSLVWSMFIFQAVFASLCVIPAFFLGRKISGNNLGGFVAALLIAVHPAFLTRTIAGFGDTDVYNVLFPLFITWLFIESITSDNLKYKLIYSVLAGLLVGLFAFCWLGWWYIFDFLIIVSVALILYNLFLKQPVKKMALAFVTFFLSSSIFVWLLAGLKNNGLFSAISYPLHFLFNFKTPTLSSNFPNVLTTVAELNPTTIKQIIESMFGTYIFLIAIAGIILCLFRKDNKKINMTYFLILLVWFLATIYASTKGIRFTMLLVPAFCLSIGVFFGIVYGKIKMLSDKVYKYSLLLLLLVVAILVLSKPIHSANNVVNNAMPLFSDGWYRSMNFVKQNTPPDSIITSWWDYGHYFKAIGDRPVTFDGASQSTPMAYWVGKILITDDEREAFGILRMLHCSSYYAFDAIYAKTNDTLKTIDILNNLTKMDKEEAKDYLIKNDLDQSVLKMTHCTPSEGIFIVSEDMVGKTGVWAHFGTWNFKKAYIYNIVKMKNKQIALQEIAKLYPNEEDVLYEQILNLQSNDQVNSWISPWPIYMSKEIECSETNSSIICQGVNYDKNTEKYNITGYERNPYSISLYRNNTMKETFIDETNNNFAFVIYYANNGYKMLVCSPILRHSMFTRMFFMNGVGLDYFELFYNDFDITTGKINIFRVRYK